MLKIISSVTALAIFFSLPQSAVASISGLSVAQRGALAESEKPTNLAKLRVRTLTDHPGRATEVTNTQKSEIQAFLQSNPELQTLICTGTSLPGQTQGMNRAVRLRAQLVCEYAQSLRPDIRTLEQLKTTRSPKHNGRVVLVAKDSGSN